MHSVILAIAGLLVLSLNGFGKEADRLYSRSFGDSGRPALIFIHGGPGYNCANFELTTAERLADSGYFVVVFDQRGCGRSKEMAESRYTLDESLADLGTIYRRHGILRATLIGHSWGGTVAGFFGERNPDMVERIVLVGSPLSYQQMFRTIISTCRSVYAERKDSVNLGYIAALERMDTASLEYSSYAFLHAMSCGLYAPSSQSPESREIYSALSSKSEGRLTMQSELPPVQGFHANERYTMFDMTDVFRRCRKAGVKMFGIYGEEDGLFDEGQFAKLRSIIGAERFSIIPDASHSVFIDQQTIFLTTLIGYLQVE